MLAGFLHIFLIAGAALTRMAAELTIGKTEYAEYNDEMELVLEEMKAVNTNLMECINRDTEAFNQVFGVFDLSKQTDKGKAILAEGIKMADEIYDEIEKSL